MQHRAGGFAQVHDERRNRRFRAPIVAVSTIPTGLPRTGIWALGAIVLLVAATACSGGGSSKAAAPAERHLVYVGGELAATESETTANADIWIADPTGAHARRLTKGFVGLLPAGRPTGAVQPKGKGLFLVPSDGKHTKRLTSARNLR